MLYSCKNGHFNCLKFFRKIQCTWNEGAFVVTIAYGQSECMHFLYKNKCPLDRRSAHDIPVRCESQCLNFLHSKCGCYSNPNTIREMNYNQCLNYWELIKAPCLIRSAIRDRDFFDTIYLNHIFQCSPSADYFILAIQHNSFFYIAIFHNMGCPFNEKCTVTAAKYGRYYVH